MDEEAKELVREYTKGFLEDLFATTLKPENDVGEEVQSLVEEVGECVSGEKIDRCFVYYTREKMESKFKKCREWKKCLDVVTMDLNSGSVTFRGKEYRLNATKLTGPGLGTRELASRYEPRELIAYVLPVDQDWSVVFDYEDVSEFPERIKEWLEELGYT